MLSPRLRPLVRRAAATLCTALCASLPVHAAQPQNPDGLWLTDGYRKLIEIEGDKLKIYQLSPLSCMFEGKALRTDDGVGPNALRFLGTAVNADISAQDAFVLRAGRNDDHMVMHVEGTVSSIELARTPDLPGVCAAPPVADTPINNFDVFAATFAENYPFFELRGVDWAAVTVRERAGITPQTSDEELYKTFRRMLVPLQDTHTFITAPSLQASYSGWRPPEPLWFNDTVRALQIISKNYVRGPLTRYCNGQLHFGMLDDGIAYLRIVSYSGYAGQGDFSVQLGRLEEALDEMFAGSSAWNGLVIDVRLNGGGSDGFGIAIASRLATKPYLAYTKVIRNDRKDPAARSRPQRVQVKTSERPSFAGNVTLLIGNESVSAAETQAMALMGRTPQVVMIGENTQGVFSDVMVRRLPNRWKFGLPNEIYLTKHGVAYDALGVPPQVRRPVFAEADLQAGHDEALSTAINYLRHNMPAAGPGGPR